jgi:hypothetical protein
MAKKSGKKAFPMGYRSPKVKAYADTPAGQRQTSATKNSAMKAALGAAIKGNAKKKKPSRPMRKNK